MNPREAAYLLRTIRREIKFFKYSPNPGKEIGRPSQEVETAFHDAVRRMCPSVTQLDTSLAAGLIRPVVRSATFIELPKKYGRMSWSVAEQRDRWASELLQSMTIFIRSGAVKSSPATRMLQQSAQEEVYRFFTEVVHELPPITYAQTLIFPRAEFNRRVAPEICQRFYSRLKEHSSPTCVWYGRFGEWSRRVGDGWNAEKDAPKNRAARELYNNLREIGITRKRLEHGDFSNGYVYTLIGRSSGRPDARPSIPMVQKPNANENRPIARKELASRIEVRKIGEPRKGLLFPRWSNIIQCNDNTDIIWTKFSVVIHQMKHEPVLIEPERSGTFVIDVVFDGENVWIASNVGGIRVITLTGELNCRIDGKDGLPAYRNHVEPDGLKGRIFGALRLSPVAPGRCIVIGSLGEHRRLWFANATTEARQGGSHLRVFHEATRHATDTSIDGDEDTKQIFKICRNQICTFSFIFSFPSELVSYC